MQFLVIDDSPYDRELVMRKLRPNFPEVDFVEVAQPAELDIALALPNIELVLTDYQLKWTTGLLILSKVRERFPALPVIMVTDTGSEVIATEGMKMGLNDYVLKKDLTHLPLAVKESLEKQRLQLEHKQLEEQVRQAQKMESLGLLVSGIAHDFNNILASIGGYTERSLAQVAVQHPLYENLRHIHEGTQRATRLVRQLLSFSRQQPHAPVPMQLNTVIASLLNFLKTTLSPQISIDFDPDPTLPIIAADLAQIEQILLNLCVNARDAMPEGGTLCLTTRSMSIDTNKHAELSAGSYTLLTVSDTGIGMDEHVLAHLFEPFFTTKDVDKGTGLGLSVIYGIIRQHNGCIEVASTPGKGTTFSLYFPVAVQTVVPDAEIPPAKMSPRVDTCPATLLLVEDEPDLRELMEDVLREEGYTVLVASDGEEGFKLFEQHADTIRLVLSDLLMPRMKGTLFQEMVLQLQPRMPFLFVSGNQGTLLDHSTPQQAKTAFLQKPFDLEDLTTRVRELIDG